MHTVVCEYHYVKGLSFRMCQNKHVRLIVWLSFVAVKTFGGFGFAAEYDVQRKFREVRLHQVAPVSTNMILSYVTQHVLNLPRSF